jgi:multiple sugar transport system substrate-binding protein
MAKPQDDAAPSPSVGQPVGQSVGQSALTGVSRRDFLLRSGLIVAGVTGGSSLLAACAGGGGGGTGPGGGGGGGAGLKILLWSHFVPSYDQWFDAWAKQWGQQNNINVVVDHIDEADLPTRTASEFSAGSGHDLIEWIVPPSAYEPDVHDMSDVVQQATSKWGDQISFCKASSYNPKTGKYYGFCHTYTPDPGDYRKSLWSAVGMGSGPTTWDELLSGGAQIKQQKKVRMGIGMSSEVDSNMAARALIWSFDGSIQDANENVTLNSKQTVDAVKYMASLYKQSMSPEVFSWTAASNNQGLIAGELSYILNSISAYRSAQTTNPNIANDIFFLPALKGPNGTGLASQHVVRSYIMPKWAKNTDKAKQFMLDLVAAGKESVKHSQLYDFPAFAHTPGSGPLPGWLANDPFHSKPPNKLQVLSTAQQWTTNVGHPGPANPAIGEIFDTNVISTMMANVARGKASPQDAVSSAHNQCESIFKKWRDKRLVGGSS